MRFVIAFIKPILCYVMLAPVNLEWTHSGNG